MTSLRPLLRKINSYQHYITHSKYRVKCNMQFVIDCKLAASMNLCFQPPSRSVENTEAGTLSNIILSSLCFIAGLKHWTVVLKGHVSLLWCDTFEHQETDWPKQDQGGLPSCLTSSLLVLVKTLRAFYHNTPYVGCCRLSSHHWK